MLLFYGWLSIDAILTQVQIHGPICLSENLDCIVVNARFKYTPHIKSLLEIFVKKNNCNLIWMDAVESIDTGS